MSYDFHRDVFADGSAEKSEGEKSGFRYTAHSLFSEDFIQHSYGKGDKGYYGKVNKR